METITIVGAVLGGLIALLAVPILLAVFLWESTKRGWHATKIPTGKIRFVVAGEKVIRVLPNIDGYHARKTEVPGQDPKWEIVPIDPTNPPKENPLSRWLKNKWGIYWVSWFYPLRRTHSFTLDKAKLKPESERSGLEIKDWVKFEKDQPVSELLWKIPRPFLAVDVELVNSVRVTILVTGIFQVIDPVLPVFIYEGNFFDFLMNVVISETTNEFKVLDLKGFIAAQKSTGSLGNLEVAIDRIIRPILGLICVKDSIGVVDYEVNKEDLASVKAEQQLIIETKLAEANKMKAKGEAALQRKPLEERLAAIKKAAGTNDSLAGVLAIAEAIGKHQGPLSLGGGGHGLSILADGNVPKPTLPQVQPPASNQPGGTPP